MNREQEIQELSVPVELVEAVLIRSDLARSLAENAEQLANDLVAYRSTGLLKYSVQTARLVLRELVELVILLDDPLPELGE